MEIAGKTRILVVDDERTIANTLSWVLEKEGYEAQAAYSGEEAVDVAQTFAPDLLICDVLMEGISGLDAAIEIRERYPSCKVLLVSGHVSIADLSDRAAEKEYKFHFLAKPVNPGILLEVLRRMLVQT
jgi:DNA-binding NtrC family response regulator